MKSLHALPKTDLHVHLDGSMRLETVIELACALPADQRLVPLASIPDAVRPPERCSLEEYLRAFSITVSVLQTQHALERATYELCADAAAENVAYMEIRFGPLLHTEQGLTPRAVVEAVLSGVRQARADYAIAVGIILAALKNESTERSMEVAQLAAQFAGKGVVAFDLAGPEQGFSPRLHREAIEFVHAAGVHLTLHAGEGCCPEHIREALDLGAERIGHGVYLYQNPKTEERVAETGIPLEVCPTSNLQISGVLDTYADHPLKRYLDLGIPVTLNTDNRLMSATSMTQEYERIVEAFSLTGDTVRTLAENGVRAAFVEREVKAALQKSITAFFAA